MRYVTVLTDAPLDADVPLETDCGSCMACVSRCPAGAIAEDKTCFDLGKCTAVLDGFVKLPYIGQHICGVCVKACSPESARRAQQARESEGGARP
jgi:epoxyqueuosine reductase QueG